MPHQNRLYATMARSIAATIAMQMTFTASPWSPMVGKTLNGNSYCEDIIPNNMKVLSNIFQIERDVSNTLIKSQGEKKKNHSQNCSYADTRLPIAMDF